MGTSTSINHNLKVSIGTKKKGAAPFTIGSSVQDVIDAMGTPTSVIGDSWGYGFSTVQFDLNGKVTSWSNMDKNLKVTMNSK
ncbi:hypothetical protein G9G63_25675 [Paenibacillus sp. EKM202P]|uniref:hypothetical protein n=1 Tax=unclassified Paenibacillus TaxID=185978 RepID=UPI0013ECC901|nr:MULTISPECIES: hypothetical protein [unclassified Paenibacillus]KAF6558377.1 hypothetical protein G9G63_25675 [Paenibacillus sp. EKM202P]KAF6563541.1 hypothetical protein G9G64_25365 [Paenibacillus sp. EKM207P]